MESEQNKNAYSTYSTDSNMSAKDFEKLYNNKENINEPNVSFDSPIFLKRMRTNDSKGVILNSELEARNNRMKSISSELSALNDSMKNITDVGVSYKQREETVELPKEEVMEVRRPQKTESENKEEIKQRTIPFIDTSAEKPKKQILKEEIKKQIEIKKNPKKSNNPLNIERFLKFYMAGIITAIVLLIATASMVLLGII